MHKYIETNPYSASPLKEFTMNNGKHCISYLMIKACTVLHHRIYLSLLGRNHFIPTEIMYIYLHNLNARSAKG